MNREKPQERDSGRDREKRRISLRTIYRYKSPITFKTQLIITGTKTMCKHLK